MDKMQQIYEYWKDKGFTDEEIADAMIIPADLTKEETEQAHQEIKKFIFERRKNMTTEEIKLSNDLRDKFNA